ncbi:MAG TPA: ABC transporter substrate-binding protein [Acidimicrobiia bacterium]|nr:ABC transporter substrate-binding protein [Acidimicrobiia bacterium]
MGHAIDARPRARTRVRARRSVALSVVLALAAAACSAEGGELSFETRAAAPAATSAADRRDAPRQEGGLFPVTAERAAAGRTTAAGGTEAGGPAVSPGASSGTGGTTPSRGVLKIGTVLPLQGGQRDFGEPVLRVTQAYIDEVNARGGVGGYTLQLVAYNACLTCQDEALQAAKRLVEEDDVFAFVNTYVMAIAFIPVIEYLDEHRIPLIQGGAEDMTSDALSPVTFATAPPGSFYGRFFVEVVKRYLQVDRIGITYLSVPTEAEAIPQLEAEFAKEGIEVVRKEPIEAAEEAVTSMDAAIARMRAAGAQGVVTTNPVLLAYGRIAADRQGWHVPWYGPAAWSHLLEDACGRICDDVVFTDTAGLSYPDRDTPQMRQFLDTMAARYPEGHTTGHELAAWVAMQLFTEVLARTGADAEAFIAEMETLANLDLGTTSPLTFSPDSHMGGNATILLKLKDGKYVRSSDPLNFGYLEE